MPLLACMLPHIPYKLQTIPSALLVVFVAFYSIVFTAIGLYIRDLFCIPAYHHWRSHFCDVTTIDLIYSSQSPTFEGLCAVNRQRKVYR